MGQDDPELCTSLARALTSQGRNAEAAVRAARRACGLDPDSADPRDALAMALYSVGQHEAAMGPAREATRLAPDAAEYVYDLGLIQEASGDAAGARTSFSRAVELEPDFEEAREALRRLDEVL